MGKYGRTRGFDGRFRRLRTRGAQRRYAVADSE